MNNQKLNSKIFEIMLEEAIIENYETKINNIHNDTEFNLCHVFSSSFEKNMNDLLRKNNIMIFLKKTKTILSKVAIWIIVLLTIITTGLLSVEASRVLIFNAVLEWKDKYVSVKFEDNNETLLENLAQYSFNYIPAGFKIHDIKVIGSNTRISYKNNNDIIIYFNWCPTSKNGTVSIDSENSEYYETKINGDKAYVFKSTTVSDKNIIIWQNNKNTLKLFSTLKIEELLKIAENICDK
ncbi:MAG: DUF4367 domain-containing protein [Ruminiclostridium sp.]